MDRYPRANLSRNDILLRKERPAHFSMCLGNFAKALLLRIFLKPGNRIIEFGSGPGSNILKLEASRPSFVSFTDIDINNLEETSRRLENRRHLSTALKYEVFYLDFTQSNFCSGRNEEMYDVALALYSLHYIAKSVDGMRIFFENCNILLRPEGKILAIVPNAQRIFDSIGSTKPNRLYDVDFGKDFIFKKIESGIPYDFRIKKGITYKEYTLCIEDILSYGPQFQLCYYGSISHFVEYHRQQYKHLAESLRSVILGNNTNILRNITSDDIDLYNLYDVIVLQKK